MIKKFLIFIVLLVNAVFAHANSDWTDAFQIIWESQWHQSGFPLNARKWYLPEGNKLIYSLPANAHKASVEYVQDAIAIISKESGIEFVQAEENAPKVQLEFLIKRFTSQELMQHNCYMQPEVKLFQYTHAKITLSEQYSYQCILHELMHAMGFSGHPLGDTVLTYFGANYRKISEIDKFLLRTWYGSEKFIVPGLNIFRVVKKTNQKWIRENVATGQQKEATEVERRWFNQMIEQMEQFADDKAEAPRILYRSGKLNHDGLRFARLQIKGMLGVAYLEGYGVKKNPVLAHELLFQGAQGGLIDAADAWFRGVGNNKFIGVDVKPACAWFKERLIAVKREDLIKQSEALLAKSCGDAFSSKVP
jgi:hypothetical protein